jgi:hypothetical protein
LAGLAAGSGSFSCARDFACGLGRQQDGSSQISISKQIGGAVR